MNMREFKIYHNKLNPRTFCICMNMTERVAFCFDECAWQRNLLDSFSNGNHSLLDYDRASKPENVSRYGSVRPQRKDVE